MTPGNRTRGPWKVGALTKGHTWKQRPDAFGPVHNLATHTWSPGSAGRVWAVATRTRAEGKTLRAKLIEALIQDGRVVWPVEDASAFYASEAEPRAALHDNTPPARRL